MSHTHFLYHIVFATKDRMPLIAAAWEAQHYAYFAGIVKNHNGLLIAIGGIADHVHLLVRLEPVILFPDFMRDLKASSSKWVRRNHLPNFSWQRRYGAFTVSESSCAAGRDYIRDQKEHHQKRTFESEYKSFLLRHQIEFDERYIWD
jgi:REP element-mobilizing transposase RayT